MGFVVNHNFSRSQGKWAFLNQFFIMAVPTGYQHQNKIRILIFYFKNIFRGHGDVPRTRFGPVFGTFLVRFGCACAHAVPIKISLMFGAWTNLPGPMSFICSFAHGIFSFVPNHDGFFFTAVWRKAPNGVSSYLHFCPPQPQISPFWLLFLPKI